jgi:hypothetical protein
LGEAIVDYLEWGKIVGLGFCCLPIPEGQGMESGITRKDRCHVLESILDFDTVLVMKSETMLYPRGFLAGELLSTEHLQSQ